MDILVEIDPDVYKSHVTNEKKGAKQLIIQCQNALYGTLVEILLYYRKFTKSLTDIGFKINPYDPCVANKIIDGQHMTISYHMNDCKLSHRRSKVNDRMIKWLRQEYESILEDGPGKMTVSRGKVHKYLGMTLDCFTPFLSVVTCKLYTSGDISANIFTRTPRILINSMYFSSSTCV